LGSYSFDETTKRVVITCNFDLLHSQESSLR
jgi:hypothetical protein